jgi:hypothetical protein
MRPHPAYIVGIVAVNVILFAYLMTPDAVGFCLLLNVTATVAWGCASKPQSNLTRNLKRLFLLTWAITIGAWVFAVLHGSDRDNLQWPSALSAVACLLVAIIVTFVYWATLIPRGWPANKAAPTDFDLNAADQK